MHSTTPQAVQTPISWHTLPTEMKLAIVDNLDGYDDVRALSKTDSKTYHACVPALFHAIHLKNYQSLVYFLNVVPRSYRRHIQSLDICTLINEPGGSCIRDEPSLVEQAQSVVSLLLSCSRLENLVMRMAGSMDKLVLTAFTHIPHLRELTISNCLMEDDAPLSERLVVYIAASLPNLRTLTLDRISRSSLHSPDLVDINPVIPRVINDDDIPPHPLLGSQLNLPSLLRLSSLQRLSIKDTHLGDAEWETTHVACNLEHLELGGHYQESDYENGLGAQRILNAAGANVKELTLATSLPPLNSSSPSLDAAPAAVSNPRHLSRLQIGPYFPIEDLSGTLTHLSSSPIESISVECFDTDDIHVSKAVEDFLSLCVCRSRSDSAEAPDVESEETERKEKKKERSEGFYTTLKRIDLAIITSVVPLCGTGFLWKEKQRRLGVEAVKSLAEFCWDLGLACGVRKIGGVSTTMSVAASKVEKSRVEGKVAEWNGCAFSS